MGHIVNSTPLLNVFLCAGQPSYDDIQHPNYIPSLRLDGKHNDTATACQKLEQYKRAQQRHRDADEQREQPQRIEDNKELKVHY